MGHTVLITGAGSGFGALAARALARAGHTVYAGVRETAGRNAPAVEGAAAYAREHGVSLEVVELDVRSQESVDAAVATVLRERGTLDVLIHNAGRLATGPSEAFTPEEIADIMDTNLLGTQRVNRAVLPHMRDRERGLVLWIGSSSTKGGTPPYLAPYFAAKAAMDSFAVSYAAELARFGIETSIVVPGPFVGTDLFAKAATATDRERRAAYDARYPGLLDHVGGRLAALAPEDADEAMVADAVVEVVGAPHGRRPFRVHVDPVDDGSEAVSEVADRARVTFLGRLGLTDLLAPHEPPAAS
ncbi:SDR family NAD(P)-dependent oxidoreductase [Streptomyces sp. NPDC026672]|uniref:SDR family NAD(P)-dependent oxidoreductase n=1 Tax=unclassified Streptomyces TaxID=2593676 RepID=UPI0033E84EB6